MNEQSWRRAKVAGFTLLEALMVMALLGLMVSLAAPAMSTLRQQHRLQAHCFTSRRPAMCCWVG